MTVISVLVRSGVEVDAATFGAANRMNQTGQLQLDAPGHVLELVPRINLNELVLETLNLTCCVVVRCCAADFTVRGQKRPHVLESLCSSLRCRLGRDRLKNRVLGSDGLDSQERSGHKIRVISSRAQGATGISE